MIFDSEKEHREIKDSLFKKEVEKPFRSDAIACLLKCRECKYFIDYSIVKSLGWKFVKNCCLLLKLDNFLKYSRCLNDADFKRLILDDLDFKPKCFEAKGKTFKL